MKLGVECTMKIAEPHESSYILASSCLFLIPSVYAYWNQLVLPSMAFALCSMASMNHWKNPEYGIRRTIDVIVSRTCSSLGILHFMVYASSHQRHVMCLGTCGMLGLYMSSCYHRTFYFPWITYHVLFHVSVMLNGMYYVYSISKMKTV
jgi:hypothetical protein